MMAALTFVIIAVSFILGRITNFKDDNKIKKLELDLSIMTNARDDWRTRHIERITKVRIEKELSDEA
jgi:hypothetical protein